MTSNCYCRWRVFALYFDEDFILVVSQTPTKTQTPLFRFVVDLSCSTYVVQRLHNKWKQVQFGPDQAAMQPTTQLPIKTHIAPVY